MILFLRLLAWLVRYPWRLGGAQVALLAATLFAMAVPWLIKEVIDVGLARGEMGLLVLLAGAVLVASALRGAFAFGQSYLTEYLGQRVAFDLRNALYDRFQRLSFAFHDTAQT
ncbi:MAG: ABC transporter ATP-binding protein, partial [Chloroflexi bacterium]|nr:ABC transporter ATP-binding protein [Chloroflexota bacterium]